MSMQLERRYMYLKPTTWVRLYYLAKERNTNISTIINMSLAALETIKYAKKRTITH